MRLTDQALPTKTSYRQSIHVVLRNIIHNSKRGSLGGVIFTVGGLHRRHKKIFLQVRMERLRIMLTANGNREIQVDSFLK